METLYYSDGQPVPADRVPLVDMGTRGVGAIYTYEPCRRCGGAGGWNGWPGFVCYRCNGRHSTRFESVTTKVYTAKALATLEKRRATTLRKQEEKAEREALERHQRFEAWYKAQADRRRLIDDVAGYDGRNSFLQDLSDKLSHETPLTEAQLDAADTALRREEEQVVRAARSEWVGAEGERLEDLELTVVFTKRLDGFYGPKILLKAVDADDNVFVTFSTSEWVWEAESGDEVTIKGTVKSHDTYQGAKQTTLTRTKRVTA